MARDVDRRGIMRALAGRLLCGASALGLVSAAAMHAKAYPGTVPAIARRA